MNPCPHPGDQQVRTVYYLMCGACKQIRLVTYCNYATECHPECTLAVPLEVPPDLLEASRAVVEAR
jgi:hypothetical protein